MAGPRRGGMGGRFAQPQEKPKDRKKTIKRLLSYLTEHRILLVGIVMSVIIYSGLTIATSIFIKNLVASLGTYDVETKQFTMNPNEGQFYLYLFLLLGTYITISVSNYFMTLFCSFLSVRVVRKMRNELFNKIIYLPISYLDNNSHGDLMSRMTNDIDNVSNAITQSLSSLISGVLTILGCLGIMIYYSPLLTLVSFFVLLLTLLVTFLIGKFVRPLFKKQQEVLGQLNGQTEEMVNGFKTVKVYNHQEKAIDEFNKYSDNFTHYSIKAQIIAGSMGPVMNFVGNVGYFLVCIFGSLLVLNNISYTLSGQPIDVSIVIMFLTTTKQFTRPINEIAQLYSSLLSALAGAERVFKVLDEKSEDFSKKEEFPVEKVKGNIDFENVNFSYTPEKKVLNNFSIDLRAGHKIALVGATGSGKTTIVNLLLRFYDIDSGSIKIDGINIQNISKKDLRDSISIVLQDPVLFGDSIENNIRYGREGATDEEIDAALEFANCSSFVEALPEGKKTILNEGATNISQGQRQLLTIARAVISDPKILILDEATSSVDTRTEKNIQDAMVRLMKNRTSIIVAHRLSTIQDADLILVLDQGQIVEKGNHQELLAMDGVYKKLYDTQFQGLDT